MSYEQALYMLEQEIAEEEYNALMEELEETDIGFNTQEEPIDFND